jgi:hypothetical protein
MFGGSGVKGGVILFRGTGGAARRYLESDRSTADEYYLGAGTALAEFAVLDRDGNVTAEGVFAPEQYADWVDWRNPFTGATRGTPRLPSHGEPAATGERRHADTRRGSPRFAEMVINAPKSLSIAAALHPDVSEALDRAQADAVAEVRSWLARHSVTRVGPRGLQEVVGVDQLETVAVVHKTSRAGDPHRHVHLQIGTRVFAASKWRGLDTAALFKQQGAIRAIGTAVIAAHPELTRMLAAHGLSLDHVTGEVVELEQYNAVLSKRATQVEHNLAILVAAWEEAHPGEEPGPVVRARMHARAWDHQRPHKKPAPEGLGCEEGWRRELAAAGYGTDPRLRPARSPKPVGIDDLSVEKLAARALDRCAAGASTWTIHDIQMHVTHLVTEAGITATGADLRDLITLATNLAASDCLSVLPPTMPRPEQVAHLTTISVVAAEETLRDLIGARVEASTPAGSEVDAMASAETEAIERLATVRGLDADQAHAAAAIASTTPLVLVEGAAGAGKTTMLGAAIAAAEVQGRPTRIVTPTKKAAAVAAQELGVPTDSVSALVYAYGWRWDKDGVWHRLKPGESDPVTGAAYAGPPARGRLCATERIVVDEAGMLDQNTATALLTVAAETGASIALVGDRAQLSAVGRGGVLDIAADLATVSGLEIHDLTGIHRFADPTYAAFTLDLRDGKRADQLFDRLQQFGLVRLHESTEAMHAALADITRPGDAVTVATNDQAREVNAAIRQARVARGEIPEVTAAVGSDSLPVGLGDLVMTRRNDNALGVANRQTWIVQQVDDEGDVWVLPASTTGRPTSKRLPAAYVAQHLHLAYASTAYGVQGMTSETAHAVVNSPTSDTFESVSLDAAGIYVGLTRGRKANLLHVVASDLDEAREQFASAMARDRADRGLKHATRAAHEAVAGLVAPTTTDADVEYVASECIRLAADIDRANAKADRWDHALAALAALDSELQRNRAPYEHAVTSARANEEAIRAAVNADLLEQAAHAADAIADAASRMYAANEAVRRSGRLGRRAAERAAQQRSNDHDRLAAAVAARWGTAPAPGADRTRWAQHAANLATNDHPSVLDAGRDKAGAVDRLALIDSNHDGVRADSRRQLLGNRRAADVRRRTSQLRGRVLATEQLLRELDTLPPSDAARTLRAISEPPVPAGTVPTLKTSAGVRMETQTCSAPGNSELRRLAEQVHRHGPSL